MMKELIILIVLLFIFHSVAAQDDDFRLEGGDNWVHVVDPYGDHWYGWKNPDGTWEWSTDQPIPWPPDIVYDNGDGSEGENGDGNEGDDGDWDEDDWDDWWDQWWIDPWDDFIDDDPIAGSDPPCPELTSRTVKAPDRTRLTIGIGEEVEVRIRNKCGAKVLWDIEGVGSLTSDPNDQREVSFQAHYTPGAIKIIAYLTGLCPECGGVNSKIELVFQVIAPTGVFFDNSSTAPHCPGIYHYQRRPSAGYSADSYLQPDNVNFYNVRIREELAQGYSSGLYFNPPKAIPDHPANSFVPCTDLVFPGKGTKISIPDDIYFEFECRLNRDVKLQGRVEWNIPNLYRDENGNVDIPFCNTLQASENVGGSLNPLFITSKENSRNSTYLWDADHCTTGINPCL